MINNTLLPFRIYQKESLLTVPDETSLPLIQDFLFQDDFVLLIAEDKMGKTILSTQMMCNLSSGTPFLGLFDIPEPVNVWYFAHEGKDDSLIDRLIRMGRGVPMDVNRMKLFCGAKFRWNDKDSLQHLRIVMDEYHDELPKVIFVDPLYAASKGDLNNNEHIKEFIHILRMVAEECKAAVVVVHHMKKNQRNDKGDYHTRNDTDAYGSATMKWAVDQMFWLDKFHAKDGTVTKENKNDRFLKCDTQRGGNISANIRLRLQQPDPLYFFPVDKYTDEGHRVLTLLKAYKGGLDIKDMIEKSELGRTALYIILKQLILDGKVLKHGTKTIYYQLS